MEYYTGVRGWVRVEVPGTYIGADEPLWGSTIMAQSPRDAKFLLWFLKEPVADLCMDVRHEPRFIFCEQ